LDIRASAAHGVLNADGDRLRQVERPCGERLLAPLLLIRRVKYYFVDEFGASGSVGVGCELDLGGCSHEDFQGMRFEHLIDPETILSLKRRAWCKYGARNFA